MSCSCIVISIGNSYIVKKVTLNLLFQWYVHFIASWRNELNTNNSDWQRKQLLNYVLRRSELSQNGKWYTYVSKWEFKAKEKYISHMKQDFEENIHVQKLYNTESYNNCNQKIPIHTEIHSLLKKGIWIGKPGEETFNEKLKEEQHSTLTNVIVGKQSDLNFMIESNNDVSLYHINLDSECDQNVWYIFTINRVTHE